MSMKCRLLPLSVRTPFDLCWFQCPRIASTSSLPRSAVCGEGIRCIASVTVSSVIPSQKSGTWHLDNLTIIMSVHFVGFLYLALSSIITLNNSFFSAALPGTWYRWSSQWSKSQISGLSTIWLATFDCPTKTTSFLSENLVLLTIFLAHSTTT